MANAPIDQNTRQGLIAVSNVDGTTIVPLYADPTTHRLLVDLASSVGTVTSVSVVTANGFAGSVATATSTPAITLSTTITGILSGNGTAISAASTTGSGSVVLATTPTLVTPVLGVATATSINGLTLTSSTGTLTIANGKTLTVSNSGTLAGGDAFVLAIAAGKTLTVSQSITLAGTDSTVMTFPTTTATIARTDAGQTFTGVQVFTSPTITTANLNGANVLAENASIQLDPAGSADGKYTGITVTATAGYTQAFGDLVYLDPTDSRWEAADANSAAGADGDARGILGMVVVAGTDGSACTILLQGIIRADAKFPTFTVNNPIYVSETAGAVTQTQPSTTDVVIRVVGAALTGDEMYFAPDFTYITHT